MKYVILILATILTGCNNRFTPPKVEMPESYLYDSSQKSDSVIINTKWWQLFGDTMLNRLENVALYNNRNAGIAASRIEQARLNLGIARAQFLPSLSLELSGEGTYTIADKIEQEYIIKPQVGWEISFWGKMHNTKQAARAEILASEYSYRSVMLSLAADVATTYFTLMQYQWSLDISRQSYDLRRQSTEIIDSMFYHGMSSAVDLEQSRGLTATAAADIPQYERAVAQTTNALCILLGINPQQLPTNRMHLNIHSLAMTDSLPTLVPTGLPSALLERRPDIMEAYWNVAKTSANIGIAQAARFPSITLTADGGLLSNTVRGITAAATPWAWSGLLSLTQPIFSFGANKRKVQVAREVNHQALLTYQQTVLTALSDVENALIAISTYGNEVAKYRALILSNQQIQLMTGELYKNGLTSYLNVIDAERTLYASQLEYSAILSQHFSSYVALYKALGGGW